MSLLISDQSPLTKHQADALEAWINADAAVLFQRFIRAEIAENIATAGENVIENAERYLDNNSLSESAKSNLQSASRLAICLQVLSEFSQKLKTPSSAVLTTKLTINDQ